MIVAEINFPNYVKNNKEREQDYLGLLIKSSLTVLNLYKKANNRNYRIKKQRLWVLEQSIKDYFDIDVDIFKLLEFIINNLCYSDNNKYVILKDDIRFKGVKLETLAKFIAAGSVNSTRSSFFKECFDLASKLTPIKLFIMKWGMV